MTQRATRVAGRARRAHGMIPDAQRTHSTSAPGRNLANPGACFRSGDRRDPGYAVVRAAGGSSGQEASEEHPKRTLAHTIHRELGMDQTSLRNKLTGFADPLKGRAFMLRSGAITIRTRPPLSHPLELSMPQGTWLSMTTRRIFCPSMISACCQFGIRSSRAAQMGSWFPYSLH